MTKERNNSVEVEITSEIVSAYVSNNPMPAESLPRLVRYVFDAVHEISTSNGNVLAEKKAPAVPVKRSVQEDYIICLEDGQKFKSLKRHLRSHYNMSPEEYREKWGLPYDYPMVAPNYAKARSRLAKEIGLGKRVVPKSD